MQKEDWETINQDGSGNRIVRGIFGEPFKLPSLVLPKTMVMAHWRDTNIPLITYNLEIEGWRDQTIQGSATIAASIQTLVEPQMCLEGMHGLHPHIFTPMGNVPIEYEVAETESKKGRIVITKIPLAISLSTKPVSGFLRNIDYICHGIIARGSLFRGASGQIDHPATTLYNEWQDFNWKGSIYLPYDPNVLKDLKIFIGDKFPTSALDKN